MKVMNKKIISAGLCLSMVMGFAANVEANEVNTENNVVQTEAGENQELRTYIFNVAEVTDTSVKLRYKGEHRSDAIEMTTEDEGKELVLDKELFDENVEFKDEYELKTPYKLDDIIASNVDKENVELIQKYIKPVNMDSSEIPENAEIKEFEVVEVFDEDAINKTVTVADVDNKNNLYTVSFDDLREAAPQVGEVYKIYWDGISMTSYPGQFGQIYRVEKIGESANVEMAKAKEVDKTNLKRVLLEAEEILFGDSSFTKESVDAFSKAEDSAKEIYDNKNASQEEVDMSTKGLREAIDNLEEKSGTITKEFVLKEFVQKGGNNAKLQSVDYPDKEFTISVDSLNNKTSQVGDHYMVTIGKVDPNAEPFEMGEIQNIEKIADKSPADDNKPVVPKDEIKPVEQTAPQATNQQAPATQPVQESRPSVGLNPGTGVGTILPVAGVLAIAGILYKKTKND